MDLTDLIGAVSQTVGLDPRLMQAIVAQESGGRSGAVSRPAAGQAQTPAYGLMQITPGTFQAVAPQVAQLTGRPASLTDPFDNLLAGGLLWRNYLQQSGGDLGTAARLYHGGPNPAGWGPRTEQYSEDIERRYASAIGRFRDQPPEAVPEQENLKMFAPEARPTPSDVAEEPPTMADTGDTGGGFSKFVGEVLGDVSLFFRPVSQWGRIPEVMAQRAAVASQPGMRSYLGQHPFMQGLLAGGGDLPPPNPVQQVQQDVAALKERALRGEQLTPQQLQLIGVHPTFAEQMAQYESGVQAPPGMRVSRLGPSGPTFQPIPQPVQIQPPPAGMQVAGGRTSPTGQFLPSYKATPIAPPSINMTPPPGMRLTGVRGTSKGELLPTFGIDKGEKITKDELAEMAAGNDPHRPGQQVTPEVAQQAKHSLDAILQAERGRTEAKTKAKPPPERMQEEFEQLKTITGGLNALQGMLQDPAVQQKLGGGDQAGILSRFLSAPIKRRLEWWEYKYGVPGGPPQWLAYQSLSDLIGKMSTSRLARSSGSRSFILWTYLATHAPNPTDDPKLTQSKITTLRALLDHTLQNGMALQGVPADQIQSTIQNLPDINPQEIIDPEARQAVGLPPSDQGETPTSTTPTTTTPPSGGAIPVEQWLAQ